MKIDMKIFFRTRHFINKLSHPLCNRRQFIWMALAPCLFLMLCVFLAFSFPVMAANSKFPADGNYSVEVTLTGGTGRASIQSPAEISVKDGEITATIIWSSSNYDRMTVEDIDYYPTAIENGSVFTIPVRLDEEMPVIAETLAMSQPHEIEYILYFDGSDLTPDTNGIPATLTVAVIAAWISIVIVIRLLTTVIHKRRK